MQSGRQTKSSSSSSSSTNFIATQVLQKLQGRQIVHRLINFRRTCTPDILFWAYSYAGTPGHLIFWRFGQIFCNTPVRPLTEALLLIFHWPGIRAALLAQHDSSFINVRLKNTLTYLPTIRPDTVRDISTKLGGKVAEISTTVTWDYFLCLPCMDQFSDQLWEAFTGWIWGFAIPWPPTRSRTLVLP